MQISINVKPFHRCPQAVGAGPEGGVPGAQGGGGPGHARPQFAPGIGQEMLLRAN